MVMPPKLREPPVLLARLLTEDSLEAKNFRLNIRSYNNLLSFASKGISGKLYIHGMHSNFRLTRMKVEAIQQYVLPDLVCYI